MTWTGAAGGRERRDRRWSRFIMSEYHNRPDATPRHCGTTSTDARGLRPATSAASTRTASCSRRPQEGHDSSGGQNVYPTTSRPCSRPIRRFRLRVIGIPHAKWGETPLGLVLLRPDHSGTDAESLCTWANERLGSSSGCRASNSAPCCRATRTASCSSTSCVNRTGNG